jgi:hypothetical protein
LRQHLEVVPLQRGSADVPQVVQCPNYTASTMVKRSKTAWAGICRGVVLGMCGPKVVAVKVTLGVVHNGFYRRENSIGIPNNGLQDLVASTVKKHGCRMGSVQRFIQMQSSHCPRVEPKAMRLS